MTKEKVFKKKSSILEWGKAIVIAVILALLIRNFLFEPYVVEGKSMDPTLVDSERLFVNKTVKYTGNFKRGDIIILNGKEKSTHYVKRLIGLPGDTVEMKNDHLFINGNEVKEPYLSYNKENAKKVGINLTGDFGPIKVPKDKYFDMGDNRQESMDSRNGLGLFTKDDIQGTEEFVFFPFSNMRKAK